MIDNGIDRLYSLSILLTKGVMFMSKLSVTSKLDGIKSFSLNALETCAGSRKPNGELVDACSGCYATQGNYRYPNVKEPRNFNKRDWQRDSWVDDMVKLLDNERYFRWFDSGDIYSVKLAWKIYKVMELTPWVKHWLPTRMYKFSKFLPVFDMMKRLPNVMVRFSSDSIVGEFDSVHGSTIIPANMKTPLGVEKCQAFMNNGKCNNCRKCWSKDIPVIAYVAHGRSMTKKLKNKGFINE